MTAGTETEKSRETHRIKARSPNFPVASLADAVERTRGLYERERRSALQRMVLAEHLGYKTLHGGARRAISALMQYGLVEDAPGDKVRISEIGEGIIHPRSDEESAALLEQALFSPAINAQLRNEYGSAFPSDRNLEVSLIREHRFTPEAAALCARNFRQSVEFVDAQRRKLQIGGSTPTPEDAGVPPEFSGSPARAPEPHVSDAIGQTTRITLPGVLSARARVELTVSGVMGRAEAEKLKRWLAAVVVPWIDFAGAEEGGEVSEKS